jgi:hypothetical protein
MHSGQQENKTNVFSGLKNLIKNSGDKIKEKFTNIFKDKKQFAPVSPNKINFNQNNNTDNKKPIFTIEEDEDQKVYNYHLEEDDEDYDYGEDNEEVQEEAKTQDKSTSNVAKVENSPEKILEKKEFNPEAIVKQEDEDWDPYDVHTVCHRIYQRDHNIDLEGMNYVKCKRLKNKNKFFSMIGVSLYFKPVRQE